MSNRKKWWYDVIPYTIFSIFITIALFCKPPMEYPCFIGTLSCIILKVTPTFLTAIFTGLALFFACFSIKGFCNLMLRMSNNGTAILQQIGHPIREFGNTLIFFISVNVITILSAVIQQLFKINCQYYTYFVVYFFIYSIMLFIDFIKSIILLLNALDTAITTLSSVKIKIDQTNITQEYEPEFK